MTGNKEPSLVLVTTWFNNLMQKESPEARDRAREMLLETFGSQEKILNYFVRHGLVKK